GTSCWLRPKGGPRSAEHAGRTAKSAIGPDANDGTRSALRSRSSSLTGFEPVNHFEYRDGVLHAEGVPVPEIAKSVGTPFYCYSTATLERHYKVFSEAFDGVDSMVCYAMKANSNQAVL